MLQHPQSSAICAQLGVLSRGSHSSVPVCTAAALTCSKLLLQVKNVGSDELEGKVGRIYMPAQDVGSMALHKMKVHTLACWLLELVSQALQSSVRCTY